MTNPTPPPRHLSTRARALWRSVLADYELAKRHQAVLCTALESLDRMRQGAGRNYQGGACAPVDGSARLGGGVQPVVVAAIARHTRSSGP